MMAGIGRRRCSEPRTGYHRVPPSGEPEERSLQDFFHWLVWTPARSVVHARPPIDLFLLVDNALPSLADGLVCVQLAHFAPACLSRESKRYAAD